MAHPLATRSDQWRNNGSISEASVYRLLKAQDLITGPAFIVIKAADAFHEKTTRPNQLSLSGHCCAMPCRSVERWHQTLKNRVLLENSYLPRALEEAVATFIDHDNHRRYPESLGNLTPADVYRGRPETILKRRKEIKATTIEKRRLLHRQTAA